MEKYKFAVSVVAMRDGKVYHNSLVFECFTEEEAVGCGYKSISMSHPSSSGWWNYSAVAVKIP